MNEDMKICLKTYAKQHGLQHIAMTLQERLPERVSGPCELTCDFQVVNHGDYYLLTLYITGKLAINCQRCLHIFQDDFYNESQLAVCVNDSVAETLMEHFDCVVASDHQVDLVELLTDELYLFSPEKHRNPMDCHSEIFQWIGGQDEIMPSTLGL